MSEHEQLLNKAARRRNGSPYLLDVTILEAVLA